MRAMRRVCPGPTIVVMISDDDLQRTRDSVSRAIADAVAEAEAVPDNAIAYRQADWLADELARGVSATSKLRAADRPEVAGRRRPVAGPAGAADRAIPRTNQPATCCASAERLAARSRSQSSP